MKKILFGLLVVISANFYANAQGFEGGRIMPSFQKRLDVVGTTDLTGGKMSYTDYPSGPITVVTKKHTDSEALSYALLLVRSPKILKLTKDLTNIIPAQTGMVVIAPHKDTGEWLLLFVPNSTGFVSNDGYRVFRLDY